MNPSIHSPVLLAKNTHQIQMSRTLLAVIAGSFAGILHIEGLLNGIMVYLVWQLIGSAVLIQYMKRPAEYFPNGSRDVITTGLFSGIMTFVLVWTLVYDIVFIF